MVKSLLFVNGLTSMKSVFMALALLLVLPTFSCASQDANYFRLHPKALLAAMANCPQRAPRHVDCQTLHSLAISVNKLVDELRMGPQAFGKTILALQENIHNPALKPQELAQQTLELKTRLAIVNWLESPVS